MESCDETVCSFSNLLLSLVELAMFKNHISSHYGKWIQLSCVWTGSALSTHPQPSVNASTAIQKTSTAPSPIHFDHSSGFVKSNFGGGVTCERNVETLTLALINMCTHTKTLTGLKDGRRFGPNKHFFHFLVYFILFFVTGGLLQYMCLELGTWSEEFRADGLRWLGPWSTVALCTV